MGADDLHYAVVVKDSEDFWLNAFDIKQEAIDYCDKYKLKIIKSN